METKFRNSVLLLPGKSTAYVRWRRLFTGMVISPDNLRYEGQIGEGTSLQSPNLWHTTLIFVLQYHLAGAFGKVYQGILKTPTPGRGVKYTTQRDVAVKMLKSESHVQYNQVM